MAAFGDNQVGRVLGGRYRLLAPVGTGASATVYLAEDAQLRRRVALKVLHPTLADDPAFLKRFRAEAQAAAQLSHPNIVAVFDWGEDGGTPYLVTEYLGAGSVRAMLDRGRLLTPSQALLVGLEAAKGLDYAHRQGFVHRDIKPANLLFGEDGRLRIADFGLARAIAEAAWTEPAGVVLGTARYASPEQAKGQSVDGRTDVYSLSLSLIEAVTGKVPFAADTTVATLMNRLDKLMPVSADLGPLASVLERAGRPDPEERFDAGQLARALVQAAERLPRPAPLPLVPTLGLERRPDDTMLGPAITVAAPAAAMARAGVGAGPDAPAGHPDPPAGELDTAAVDSEAPPSPAVAGEPVLPGASPVTTAGRPAGGGPAGGGPADGSLPPREPGAVAGERRPRRTLRVFLAVMVALALAAIGAVGVLFYQNSQVPSYAVPPLVGLEESRARNLVEPNEWAVRVVSEKNDTQPAGLVFAQDPESGELKRGEPFTIFVSAGPTDSPVPDLTGRTGVEAQGLLDEQRLLYNLVEERFDEDVPAGVVITWSVGGQPAPPGTMIVKGSTVDVVVSLGPAPRIVPKLVGRTFEEAEAALAEQRLGVNRLPDEFSDEVEAGRVMRIDPAAGAEVPRDTVVTVVVSKGPDLVTVPDVKGQALADARANLEAAGVALGQVAGPETSPVIATSPAAGAVVRRGSAVNVLLG